MSIERGSESLAPIPRLKDQGLLDRPNGSEKVWSAETMKLAKLQKMSVAELVERFTLLCLSQFQAELRGENAKEGQLIRQSMAVADELKRRVGDQRSALIQLYDHPNPQVRLMAAKETFSIAPAAARQVMQAIVDAKEYPQAGDAGMSLWFRDRGDFIPR